MRDPAAALGAQVSNFDSRTVLPPPLRLGFYSAMRAFIGLALGFYFRRIERFHEERVPASGPLLLTSNHPNSLTDSFVIGAAVGRKVNFVATVQLFRFGPLKWLLTRCGVIPINRVKDDAKAMRTVAETFEACFRVLERGEAVGIFPEGITYEENSDGEKLIYQYIKKAHGFDKSLRLTSYTSDDSGHKDLLKAFSEGDIDIVFAMKMLDEGIDVPRTEIGIFASSTGNPRQYIQRRGRLLRTHKEKAFASIYDMIVAPQSLNHDPSLFKVEQNLLKAELIRVAYFASLSMNFKDTKFALNDLCTKYSLDIDSLILDLQE